jgi:chromosome transmission fidelity protein 1
MLSVAKESWLPSAGAGAELSGENRTSISISQSKSKSRSNRNDGFECKNDYPTSQSLPFPYPTGPYPQQAALMDTLLEGIPRKVRQKQQQQQELSPSETKTETPKTRILALESPTGTGKSLSLACAGLAWLDHEEGLYYRYDSNETTADAGPTPQANGAARSSPTSVIENETVNETVIETANANSGTTGFDWLDAWQPQEEDDRERKERDALDREFERHQSLVEALDELRLRLHPAASKIGNSSNSNSSSCNNINKTSESKLKSEPRNNNNNNNINNINNNNNNINNKNNQKQRLREKRENLLRMTLTKSRMEERKRVREKNRKRKRNSIAASRTGPLLAYENENEDDEDDENDNSVGGNSSEERRTRKIANLTPGTAEWLLRNPHWKGGGASKARPPQIVYAARTHSQLSQFVSEIRKTKWGGTLRVVALGSRGQGLCGAFTTPHHNKTSEARLTEACLDLRKNKNSKTTGGCSHYPSDESVSTLALHGMVEATDLEDLVELGRATKTCAYYAARATVPHAQLIVLPYASLCSPSSREALGLTLHCNTLVLVDEAHNLPNTIANLTSATVTMGAVVGARDQLHNYLQKYVDRLTPHHLRLLGDLKRLIRGLIASMAAHSGTKHTPLRKQKQQHSQQQQQSDTEQQRFLLSSSQFLVSQKLETINLFPVLRYMKESRLSQKLLGFMKKPGDATASSDANHNDDDERIPSHISPISVVETFLEKLTFASDDDGQVVIDKGDDFQISSNHASSPSLGGRTEAHLRFCVLNPAVQARDKLWTAPRAVALVGGTLQPLDVMMRELIPGKIAQHAARAQSSWNHPHSEIYDCPAPSQSVSNPYRKKEDPSRATTANATTAAFKGGHGAASKETKIYKSDDFWAFTCGHVVDPSQVLLQSLTRAGSLSIDVRHKTRSTPSMTRAIGTALVKLCQSVQHGMVVFLPSYKYEAILVDAWKKQPTKDSTEGSIWDQLQQATKVVREPKEASQVEATLAAYSRAATRSPRGALLLSVVGGKLSEGINFADDLCRCVVVVGLPFADRSDPLLQEKLKLVAATGASSKAAASDYYRSLCLRAVNQSVGRAIRHAKDWATIVLMDARYPSDEAIARGLPSWLTGSTPSWRKDSGDLEDVLRRTDAFFDGRQPRR